MQELFTLPCRFFEIITWNIPGNTLCKQKCITYSFIVDNPNILGNFLLFVGKNQLGENYLTYSHIGGGGVPEHFR